MCNRKPWPFSAPQLEAIRHQLVFVHFPDAYALEVFDCDSASKARNVPLNHELKHLLLDTDAGYCLAHITGNLRLSLREVKTCLGVRQAHLADLDEFPHARVKRGTVCPFIEPLWSLPHLIDHSVLQMSHMTTNDGTTRGYLKFDPAILSFASKHFVGNFATQ